MSHHYRNPPYTDEEIDTFNEFGLYNLDDYFIERGPDNRHKGYGYRGYTPTSKTISKDTEIYFSDKVQKFILENISNNLEWYIFSYGRKEIHQDRIVFFVEEYSLPVQKRTVGTVKVDETFKTISHVEMCEKFPDYHYVGLIHSHHNMTAIFSTTDKEDIDGFKTMCPEAGFSIVFALPGKKYTRIIGKDCPSLSNLRFDTKSWEKGKYINGDTILFYSPIDLDYTSGELLDTNDEEVEKVATYKRVLKCRKSLSGRLVTEHLDKLSRRQLEALLWATGMDSDERNNLALVLRTGHWLEKEEELEEAG